MDDSVYTRTIWTNQDKYNVPINLTHDVNKFLGEAFSKSTKVVQIWLFYLPGALPRRLACSRVLQCMYPTFCSSLSLAILNYPYVGLGYPQYHPVYLDIYRFLLEQAGIS